jgi:tetratricopeptide (TPR) repeat protein
LALRAELLVRQNKPHEAVELITTDLPSRPTAADDSRLARAFVLLRDLKLYTAAEQVIRQLAQLDPNNRPALAEFLGYYGNVEEAFRILKGLAKVSRAQLAQVGANIVRARRAEVGNKFDAQIEAWLKEAGSEPTATVLNLKTAATLADVQGRYADEEQVYRQLLARDDVQGNLRALVLNNLAFNLAMRNKSDADARKLVEEAIQIHGPTGDLLDTRAMVGLLAGEHARAISDLNLAISDRAKPERLFHLALAHLAAGNKEAALRAYREAMRRGLEASEISPLERPHYERLVRELGTGSRDIQPHDQQAAETRAANPG